MPVVQHLILASASTARRATLRAAGLEPQVLVSGVDEDAVLAGAQGHAPNGAVALLARAKAEQVAADLVLGDPARDGLVLGCDSMLELDGALQGKPADADEARRRWRRMSGASGTLHTGHWLIRLDATGGRARAAGATSSTTVHFAEVDDAEIEAYVATGEPLAVAGAFTVDGVGSAFVRGIEGDHHGVVGVSVPLLRELAGRLGVFWPDLWRRDVRDRSAQGA